VSPPKSNPILRRIAIGVPIVLAALVLLDVIMLATISVGFVPYRALGSPTELMTAATKGDDQALAALIRSGADVNAQRGQTWKLKLCIIVACSGTSSAFGQTALMLAAEAQSAHSVKVLLDAGADPDLRDSAGLDAIDHSLLRGGQYRGADLLELLLSHHNGILSDSTVAGALYQAYEAGLSGLVRHLLAMASPSVVWSHAVRTGNLNLARTTLPLVNDEQAAFSSLCDSMKTDSSAFLDLYREQRNHLPDLVANCIGGPVTLEYLLDHGLDPNEIGQAGMSMLAGLMLGTPIGLAQTCDCRDLRAVYMVQVLLRHGADPHAASPGGPDAIQQTHGQPVLLDLLRTGQFHITPSVAPLICPDSRLPCPGSYPLHGIPKQ
jgi:hypothetical protein